MTCFYLFTAVPVYHRRRITQQLIWRRLAAVGNSVGGGGRWAGAEGECEARDTARARANTALAAHFSSGFSVACVHLPCFFGAAWKDRVVELHAQALADHLASFDRPYVPRRGQARTRHSS